MTFEEIMSKYILPIIVSGIAGIPGILALFRQVKKDRAESAKINAEAIRVEADSSRVFYDLARDAGADVITRNVRIEALEKSVKETNAKVDQLMQERAQLEAEKVTQNALIVSLQNRVKKLEDILRSNNIPIPLNGEMA